jgi:hypothetical protein
MPAKAGIQHETHCLFSAARVFVFELDSGFRRNDDVGWVFVCATASLLERGFLRALPLRYLSAS